MCRILYHSKLFALDIKVSEGEINYDEICEKFCTAKHLNEDKHAAVNNAEGEKAGSSSRIMHCNELDVY